jgi:hypothetical protein
MMALILGLAAAWRFSLTGKEVRVYVRIFYGRSCVAMKMGRGRPIGGGGEGERRKISYSGQGPLGDTYPGGLCVFEEDHEFSQK